MRRVGQPTYGFGMVIEYCKIDASWQALGIQKKIPTASESG